MKRIVMAMMVGAVAAHGALAGTVTETIELERRGDATGATVTARYVTLVDDALEIVIRCGDDVDCSAVGARLTTPGGSTIPQTLDGSGSLRRVTIPRTQVATGSFEFRVTVDGRDLPGSMIGITGGAAAVAGSRAAASTGAGLFELLTHPCDVEVQPGRYDLAGNEATIVVTPLGRVLDSNADAFDENDTLVVKVVAHPELADRLVVERSSAFRDRTEIRILGEGTERDDFRLQAGAVVACEVVEWRLTDFAPGRGTVRISVRAAVDEVIPVANVELFVDPLYVGQFSAGPIWTTNVDPDLGLVSDGSQNLIAATSTGGHDLQYGVFFTPFVWGKRDVEKDRAWYRRHGTRYPYWQHVNPSLGLLFDDVDRNALAGLSVDLPHGFVVTGGWHFREVERLDPAAGLAPGDPFAGTAAELPVVRSWEDDSFVAVTFDLRILVRLLKATVR